MTTLSAKADGFLGHARSNLPRFVPNAQSERAVKDITGSVDITVNDQPAVRTRVNTLSKGFRNIREASALGAYLGGSLGVYPDKLPTSVFCFVGELGQERTPSRITDRLSQHTSGQSLDIQILDGDKAVIIDDLPTELMLEVRPLVVDVYMSLLEKANCLPPVGTTLPASGNLPLASSQFSKSCFEIPRVRNQLTIRKSSEGVKPQIYANNFWRGRGTANINHHTEAGIPLTDLPLQCQRLNLTSNGAMRLQFDNANTLYFEPSSRSDVAAISPNREGIAIEPITGLEPGIARFLSRLYPTKESSEGLINPPEHILAGRKISKVKVASIPNLLKLVSLVVVVKANFLHPPRISTLLKCSIIQESSLRKLMSKSYRLFLIWVKAILKGWSQKLMPSFTNFATRYNDKAGIGRLDCNYITEKEVGQFLCQLKQAVSLP